MYFVGGHFVAQRPIHQLVTLNQTQTFKTL